jgi:hypothetical protein
VWKEQVLLELAMDHLTKTCAARGRLADPLVRQRLAQSWIDVEIFRLHNLRTLTRLALGLELGTVRSRLHRGRMELKEKLERFLP